MATHYEVLGVDPAATHEEVRRAYLRRARALHPDLRVTEDHDRGGRDGAMRDVNEAWRVLGDPDRRQAYDLALRRRSRPGPAPRAGPAAGPRPAPQRRPAASSGPHHTGSGHTGPGHTGPGETRLGHSAPATVRYRGWVALLVVVVGFFAFTAYAGPGGEDPQPAREERPARRAAGALPAGSCVEVQPGLGLTAVSCSRDHDAVVVGSLSPHDECPAGTLRQPLTNRPDVLCLLDR